MKERIIFYGVLMARFSQEEMRTILLLLKEILNLQW